MDSELQKLPGRREASGSGLLFRSGLGSYNLARDQIYHSILRNQRHALSGLPERTLQDLHLGRLTAHSEVIHMGGKTCNPSQPASGDYGHSEEQASLSVRFERNRLGGLRPIR
jgi:hypothetical protein